MLQLEQIAMADVFEPVRDRRCLERFWKVRLHRLEDLSVSLGELDLPAIERASMSFAHS